MILWLDDERPAPEGWHHLRTAAECIAALEANRVDLVSLDHDLGPPEAGTGYDVLRWLEERAYAGGHVPMIALHTANPVARARMVQAVESIERMRHG